MSRYDLFPVLPVPAGASACAQGWTAIGERLKGAIAQRGGTKTVVVVECYFGVREDRVLRELTAALRPTLALPMRQALRPAGEIDALVAPYLGDDPVFGRMCDLELPAFFSAEHVSALRKRVEAAACGVILLVGCGARLVADGDILVYADLARWEAQQRQRRHEIACLGNDDLRAPASALYKRGYFVDWRVCDRWKLPLIERWDYCLDTHEADEPKLADGEAVRGALRGATGRPFRVVPFFDPAPWGGQWLRQQFGLDPRPVNYGWGFDCVPEENSLLLDFGGMRFELPALDLVLYRPRELLGDKVHARFGAEFPIRFDFLDTMGGGNLSFQVHPLDPYVQRAFGLAYTQDESYYLLETGAHASVFLGLKEGVEPAAMMAALRAAQAGGPAFPAERFANRWPARKHDHFIIPAGTVHGSGANAVVLEISATPYIFTFKLWDWGRLGLDGKPRPVHLDRGEANIQWERTTEWTRRQLLNRIEPVASGDGWREERTGLQPGHFIETRRHWFTKTAPHAATGTVNVLNLVEGTGAVVESPDGAFSPYAVHYAETFIVPAAAGPFTVRPEKGGAPCATVKAYVRTG